MAQMMAQMTVAVRLAWWFPIAVAVLAPFGRLGLRLPRRLTTWIATKAAKVEVV